MAVQRVPVGQGLWLGDVEGRQADLAVIQRVQQRLLIKQATAGDIDQVQPRQRWPVPYDR